MQPVRKSNDSKLKTKKITQDDLVKSAEKEEKIKRNVYSVSTPRNFLQKSSTADIYAKKKPAQGPKKMTGTPRISESPMKDLLKSSPSSTSISSRSSRNKLESSRTMKSSLNSAKSTPKKFVLSNVTVNSPVVKRKLNLDMGSNSSRTNNRTNVIDKKQPAISTKTTDQVPGRQRTKTRTLEEDEVKILTPEAIDNNAAMQDLSRKLAAKPKAFYVDLEDTSKESKNIPKKQKDKSSEEDEVSYEDDFESYESDFDSYHSETQSEVQSDGTRHSESNGEHDEQMEKDEEVVSKEVKDEEKMLDSGNFDLREAQRSATRKPAMDFILEGAEDSTDDKKASLTDEGFQEMSSSSAVSSMKTVHTEVLERPLFIDFTKSKENKRKRRIFERLKQRASDILSMVTLHEMSYSLFEMKPIPYDVYMATFGRNNYTQTAVQTFDDGINEEIQTDDILYCSKWTQLPVEFSKSNIVYSEKTVRTDRSNMEDYLSKFDFIVNQENDDRNDTENEEYIINPLKIFLEQKDGVGNDFSLAEEKYKSKLKNIDFNVTKLSKFLKKSEGRLSSILSLNAGSNDMLNVVSSSKLPFSNGYLCISCKNLADEKLSYLKYSKTIGVAISETKDNLIMTYHKKSANSDVVKCIICLWDTSVVRCEPIKILKATDYVIIGRYRGNTNGIFVAALDDGTLHLWDLSEEPTWCSNIASANDENSTKLVENDPSQMSQIEKDREWNLKNSNVTYHEKSPCTMQVSAYTSSAVNMYNKDSIDNIVGLEFAGDAKETSQNAGRKIVGQICTLQKSGVLTVWSILQEKTTTIRDIGKAYWSKLKLEKFQTIYLFDHVDTSVTNVHNNFNLNAAKRRLSSRKQERIERRKEISRPKSAILKNLDRPSSVSSPRKNLPISRNTCDWDYSVIYNHLKILRLNKIDSYLMAASNGEVLNCKRNLRDVKVDRICVASYKSPITRLEVTHDNLPYFLAATDSGTVHLCSLLDARVLLTLDCRNGPPTTIDKCQADSKGRFIATVPTKSASDIDSSYGVSSNLSIKSLTWLPTNPFCIIAVTSGGAAVTWELTHSDIHAKSVLENTAVDCASSRFSSLALITPEGDIQIHRLSSEKDRTIDLFKKYVALL